MPSCSMYIVVIEDDEPKLDAVCQFLSALPFEVEVRVARSLSSAISAIESGPVSLAIIDMSLPSYDLAEDRAGGGAPQGHGGEDILRFLQVEHPEARSVVLTQYEEFPSGDASDFSRVSLSDLTVRLETNFGDSFLGAIFYSDRHGDWRSVLADIIKGIRENGH